MRCTFRALLALLATACGGDPPEVVPQPSDDTILVGQVLVTYLDEDLPVLGPVALPLQASRDGEGPWLSCACDADRIVVSVSFGPWWSFVEVRLALCRDESELRLAAVDLTALGDLPPGEAFPPATGSVLVRQGAAGAIELAFDLQSAGARFRANAQVDPASCPALGSDEVKVYLGQPLPDCAPRAAR